MPWTYWFIYMRIHPALAPLERSGKTQTQHSLERRLQKQFQTLYWSRWSEWIYIQPPKGTISVSLKCKQGRKEWKKIKDGGARRQGARRLRGLVWCIWGYWSVHCAGNTGKERVGNDGCACRQHWTNLLANGQQRQLSRHCFIKATHYKSLIFTQGDSVIEAWSPCAQKFIAAGPAGHWTRRRRVKIDVTFIWIWAGLALL